MKPSRFLTAAFVLATMVWGGWHPWHSLKPPSVSHDRAPKHEEVVRGPALYSLSQRAQGRALADRLECARCHEAAGTLQPVAPEKNCITCHQAVLTGTLDASDVPEAQMNLWAEHIVNLVATPSLSGLSHRMRAQWFVAYIQRPHDLRPQLGASMPRLRISEEEAWALAAHFGLPSEPAASTYTEGRAERGRQLVEEKQCRSCHIQSKPGWQSIHGSGKNPASLLAPEFSGVMGRMPQGVLIAWLLDPASIKPDTTMPNLGLTKEEARDIATYLHTLRPQDKPPMPTRLPRLKRRVAYEEVEARVFKKMCWHCHSDPALNRDDGGPGNTGGFGYVGKQLDFSSEEGASLGVVLQDGTERALFDLDDQGVPHVVGHLMARHSEVGGNPVPGVLGMPLGHPPLPLEEIQLVETWAHQANEARGE